MEYKKILELQEELLMYGHHQNDELGEACIKLAALLNSIDYVGEDFYQALLKEVQMKLDNFRNNTRLVAKTETRLETWTELEWIDDD